MVNCRYFLAILMDKQPVNAKLLSKLIWEPRKSKGANRGFWTSLVHDNYSIATQ